jgi:hypothetical protein
VSNAVRVFAKVLMLKAMGVCNVMEGGTWKVEVAFTNCGMKMG